MDSSSLIHENGGAVGFMCAYAGRCTSAFQYREQEQQHGLLVSSEIQQHLKQIHMELNIDDDEPAAVYSRQGSSVVDFLTNSYHATGGCSFPSSSSISASFSCSPETSSTAGHVLTAPATTGHQFPEVSSLVAPGGVVLLPYDDDEQYVDNIHHTPVTTAPGGMPSTSAFRRYDRHLAPQSRLTTPACGQRMFKTAMSVLANMHTAMRNSHHQQQQASAAEPLGHQHQLQHLISERRRRQKLNDSFRALKTVLPLGPKSKKSGQASILIAAREYVNSLKSKVCELEEKNEALQSELARHATSVKGDGASEKVEIQITRAAAAEDQQNGEVCMVKILTPARGNTTTDVVLRILQRLKDVMGENVSLVSMSTGEDGDEPRRASLTLQLKSASGTKWEEEAVREAVMKALTSPAPASLSDAE